MGVMSESYSPVRWWRKSQLLHYSLLGKVCPECERKNFPPNRPICVSCGAKLQVLIDVANDLLKKDDIIIYEQAGRVGG